MSQHIYGFGVAERFAAQASQIIEILGEGQQRGWKQISSRLQSLA
jgi:hypothetical protein